MVADLGNEDVDYELALRVIGRHLDAEPSYHMSILEVDDGFTVRYHPTQHRSEGRTVRFPRERLRDLFVFQIAGRGLHGRHQRHAGMWGKFPDGHQEFLRSLGAVLDLEGASCLALDELPDEVRVSYVRPDRRNSLRTEKCERVYRESDIDALVHDARMRRETKLYDVKG